MVHEARIRMTARIRLPAHGLLMHRLLMHGLLTQSRRFRGQRRLRGYRIAARKASSRTSPRNSFTDSLSASRIIRVTVLMIEILLFTPVELARRGYARRRLERLVQLSGISDSAERKL